MEFPKHHHTVSTTLSGCFILWGVKTLIIFVSKMEARQTCPQLFLSAWIKKWGSKLVCLVLSQHFCCSRSPRQPWQDIDGPLLSIPLYSPVFATASSPALKGVHTLSLLPLPPHTSLSAGQRVQTPGGEELSGSLSTVLLPPLRLQSSDVRGGDWK